MSSGQILIKVILVTIFIVLALAIIVPRESARGLAIRRISWLLGIFLAIIAVIFPSMTDHVANFVGVGRGADLILYLSIVFFIGFAFATGSHMRKLDRKLTLLSRKYALLEAELRADNHCLGE